MRDFNQIFFAFLVSMLNVGSIQAQLSRITVSTNSFVDENGEAVIFRGYSTSDPDKLENDGLWNKKYFKELKAWGANIVRFPVHPRRLNNRGWDDYLKLLDKGVQWAGASGMYVIIDWHSIGNLNAEKYQAPIYHTTKEETYKFWDIISKKYGKNTTVACYELFNEPTTNNNEWGSCSWEEWKELNLKMIEVVRKNGAEGIPLIAGFNWAYNLNPVEDDPIPAEGIGYVSHPYPQKVGKPWEDQWTRDWGFVKENYPLILTEIGFCEEDDPGAHIPVISDESYGVAITDYCDTRGISFVGWVFDKEWSPNMFVDDDFSPSRQGTFFRKKLLEYDK